MDLQAQDLAWRAMEEPPGIAGGIPRTDGPAGRDRIDEIVGQIHQRLKHCRFVVSLSHDDYLAVVGGVQVYMLDEQDALAAQKVSYVQVYPTQHLAELADSPDDLRLSINVDSVPLGSFLAADVARIFEGLTGQTDNRQTDKACLCIQIHHLLGWHLDVVSALIRATRPKQRFFWLHDLFSICPQFTLLLNGRRFCNAPSLDSNACTICRFGPSRKRALAQFLRLFNAHPFTFIAPSRFTLDLWSRENPQIASSRLVAPHARLVKQEGTSTPLPDKALRPNYRPRLAFVGLPMTMKGWKVWRRFVDNEALSKHYDLFHFGSRPKGKPRERFVSVTVTREDRHAMVNAIRAHEIDIVLIWSIGPESFCYVLYEAMAAGCFVVARTDSGNVADYVGSHRNGMVLESEDQLLEFFGDRDKVRFCLSAFRRQHPHYYDIVRNFKVSAMIAGEEDQEEKPSEGVLHDAMFHFNHQQLSPKGPSAWRELETA